MQSTTIQKTQTGTGSSPSNSNRPNKQNTGSTSRRPKGKSKFAQKARVSENRKPVAAKPRGPVFSYVSVCCNVPATKKPCVAVGKKDALTQTLGKFRCTGCKKPAKVSRSKYVASETLVEVPVVVAS